MFATGFNGATAMKPWKRRAAPIVSPPTIPLQWGHGDKAVEEKERRRDRGDVEVASMGPRR